MLGKRKETHRRQNMTFEVPISEAKGASGCATLEEVVQRVDEFVASTSGLELIEDSYDTSSSEQSRAREFQIVQLSNTCDAAHTERHTENRVIELAGRLHLVECRDAEEFDVTVAFSEGSRAEFWKMAERLKGAITRTGRRWRRKVTGTTSKE